MKISGIYQIQSKIKPERIYIGSAINMGSRWTRHMWELKTGSHGNSRLQNHYNKYGESDFVFSILLGCKKEDLIKTEQFFIDSYKPFFNICPIAGNTLGRKVSDKARINLKKAWERRSPESKRIHLGHKHSEETKLKIRNANIGKVPSEETCKKMSESQKGKHFYMIGRKASEETKRKMSIIHKGNNNSFFGKKHSEESKEKNRKAHLGIIPWNKGIKNNENKILKLIV